MFNVTVSFGSKMWQFMFHNFDRAEDIIKEYQTLRGNDADARIVIVDDFGNTALIDVVTIDGILIENYTKSVEAAIERHIIQARAQAKAQSKINNDPLLRMVGPMNGPMPGTRPF